LAVIYFEQEKPCFTSNGEKMNIGSIGGSFTNQAVQRTPEASETKNVPDNDGDSDDQGVKAAPTQSVNTNGQLVGQLINAVA
jgi:hypothetical protein